MIIFGLIIPSPKAGELITNGGVFALVGALTNWAALQWFYRIGVISNRFTEFKIALKSFIMKEFFSIEIVENILTSRRGEILYDFSHIDACLDYDQLYEAMVEAILDSPVGSVIKLAGGQHRLEPLRDVFKNKIRKIILDYSHSDAMRTKLIASTDSKAIAKNLIIKIDQVVDIHLSELTQTKVKKLIQNRVSEPLGWLVVGSGFLGCLMGLIKTVLF